MIGSEPSGSRDFRPLAPVVVPSTRRASGAATFARIERNAAALTKSSSSAGSARVIAASSGQACKSARGPSFWLAVQLCPLRPHRESALICGQLTHSRTDLREDIDGSGGRSSTGR